MMPYMVITVVSIVYYTATCSNPNHWAEGIATYQVDHKLTDSETPPYGL